MMQIYELSKEIEQLMMEHDAGHFDDATLHDTLEAMDFESSAEEFIAAYKNIIAECDALKSEEAKLKERRKEREQKAERWKGYLLEKMQLLGIKKIGQLHQASLRKSSRVEIDDTTLLPSNYLRIKPAPEPEPDKVAIKNAINNGESVPGARLVQSQNINIA